MNIFRVGKQAKNVVLGISIAMILFLFSSCAVKETFLTSSVAPAAEGKVKVTRDKNENYVIKVDVTNLAEVEKLQTDNTSYVVWMKTDMGETQNLGQLNSSSGFMSKKLEGSLSSVSSYKPARVFITAENSSNVRYPGTLVILTTNTF